MTPNLLNSFIKFPVSGAVGGWVELARASGAALPDVTSIADKRYYMILNHAVRSTVSPAIGLRVNNDSGSNYAKRASNDGGTDGTSTSNDNLLFITDSGGGSAAEFFTAGYFANLSSKEKLFQSSSSYSRGGLGAGNAPHRTEYAGKWANTSDALDQLTVVNNNTGSFTTDGELVVLGWDPADTHTTNFWEELASVELGSPGSNLSSGTITAKKYLWVQAYFLASGAINERMTFNNDTGSNYSRRTSFDGGADGTAVNGADIQFNNTTTTAFLNMFIINNSANEKLCIMHTVDEAGAGAGNDPQRAEIIGKWANTVDSITEIDFDETGAGSYDTGSIIKVWGSN